MGDTLGTENVSIFDDITEETAEVDNLRRLKVTYYGNLKNKSKLIYSNNITTSSKTLQTIGEYTVPVGKKLGITFYGVYADLETFYNTNKRLGNIIISVDEGSGYTEIHKRYYDVYRNSNRNEYYNFINPEGVFILNAGQKIKIECKPKITRDIYWEFYIYGYLYE